jgi:hypothetical protein
MNHDKMTMSVYNEFFRNAKPRTANALQLQRGWDMWYNTLGWYEKTVGSPHTLRDAKARTIAFQTMNGDSSSFGADLTSRDTIRLGSTGPSVAAWQQVLGLPQTGVFDSALQAATKSYQQSHGLTADGIVGTNTWGSVPLPKTSVLSTYKSRLLQSGPIGLTGIALVAGGIFAAVLIPPSHR